MHPLTVDVDVFIAQGRQAKGLVLAHVRLVPDPDQRLIEEADDRGNRLVVGEPAFA